jgi:hypothetical protein
MKSRWLLNTLFRRMDTVFDAAVGSTEYSEEGTGIITMRIDAVKIHAASRSWDKKKVRVGGEMQT